MTKCDFCQQTPSAVQVSDGDTPQYLCVKHFFTTSAVQTADAAPIVNDDVAFAQQLRPMQAMFADAFVELQKELAEESARQGDPLALVQSLHRRRKKPPPPKPALSSTITGGGFLRSVPLPERLLRTQQEQARLHKELQSRMEQATRRREPSRQSIWNVVMEDQRKRPPSTAVDLTSTSDVTCTACGSASVESLSMNTSRGQDMSKGEIWGSKDRSDEVIARYRCNDCGRTWKEEE